jgi:hypothetical protein
MENAIELNRAKQMARNGLPNGNLPVWNMIEFEQYGQNLDSILDHGQSPIRHGNWLYDPETIVLCHIPKNYEIDIEQITTAPQLLDWILQIGRRPDMQVEEMLVLLQIVAEFRGVGSLQGAFCSFGRAMPSVKW